MARTVTTRTISALAGAGMTATEVTVLLVPMTAAQVAAWKWVGDEWAGEDPVDGYEVRDTTGALLGVILPLGHMARHLHVEYYDPRTEEFYAAGETPDAVLTQGIAYVVDAYAQHVRAVPTGEGFTLDAPVYVPACWTGTCGEDCQLCDYVPWQGQLGHWVAV